MSRRLSLAADNAGGPADSALVGETPVMRTLFRRIEQLAASDLPVMLVGEPGVGKTAFAQLLHRLSDRAGTTLARVDAADGPEAIQRAVDSASGGSLLIENPAELDPPAQARLVALLDRATDDAPRLVATGGFDPRRDVARGRLRADLFHRLSGAIVPVPPLSARREDVPLLVRHLTARHSGRTIGEDLLATLAQRDFPGNVRELELLIRRLAATGQGPVGAGELDAPPDTLSPDPLPLEATGQLAASVAAHLQRYFDLHGDQLPPPGLYDRILREIESPLLRIALDATGGNQLRCAELLGLNRNTLRKKMAERNIQVTRSRRVM
ncbi:sigma-54-dependent transcriptional regulator [Paracoccus jeotgali]|uniref:sigma-54-dependent transcriptional regulator n=1 Tax=Paracoccus jeotgali TaxID=2065379 RepID=UPI0028AF97D8|nr:sigma 54-interacting transcriptional regulator [Paracoccus jeotgali]